MTIEQKFGITKKSYNKLLGLFARNPQIERVVIYGSRAMGTYQNGSDIDLTLVGEGLDFNFLAHILCEIENLDLPYMVDLSIFNLIDNQCLVDHIRKIGKDFYTKMKQDLNE